MAKGNGGTRVAEGNRWVGMQYAHDHFSYYNTPRSRYLAVNDILGHPEFAGELKDKVRRDASDFSRKLYYSETSAFFSPVAFNEFIREKGYEEKLVNLADIYSVQGFADEGTVRQYVEGTNPQASKDPIIGFRVKGSKEVVIVNGNHRVVAERIKGGNSVRMVVINAPKKYFKDLQK